MIDDDRRRVDAVARPRVSVLMVTYGARVWVERALRALVDHTPPVYELIIVDNGSTDGTRGYLRDSIEGALVIESPRNLGFGLGNNLAAMHARGEFLCLLNSDAIVPANWLEPLLERFDDPRVGAVVPLYVFPDGTLQEAGSVVEADGRVVALGVRGDSDDPSWRFARTITYGSAACMLVRRSVFQALGGFDPEYGTAYYEDVDLAFRLTTMDLRVVIEPAVRIVHAQGASSPTPADAATRRDANQSRFRTRWAPMLGHRPQMFGAPRPHRFYAARDVEAVDRILLLSPELPGVQDELFHTARTLAVALDQGLVTIATLRDTGDRSAVDQLLAAGVEVAVVDHGDAWLNARCFHFAAVLAARPELDALAGALRATQPQATCSAPPDPAIVRDPERLAAWLLDLGLVPRAARPRSPSALRLPSPA
jgi:GT2 family glycosyltransferase